MVPLGIWWLLQPYHPSWMLNTWTVSSSFRRIHMDQVIEESRYTVYIYIYIHFHIYMQYVDFMCTCRYVRCIWHITCSIEKKTVPMHMYRPQKKTIILRLAEIYTSSCWDGLHPVTDGCPWPTEDSAMAWPVAALKDRNFGQRWRNGGGSFVYQKRW